MTDPIKAALDTAVETIAQVQGDDGFPLEERYTREELRRISAAGIAAFLRALPGLSVAIVESGSASLVLGKTARGKCMSGDHLAAAVQRAGGGDAKINGAINGE